LKTSPPDAASAYTSMLGNARLIVQRVAEAKKAKTWDKPENAEKGSLHFI